MDNIISSYTANQAVEDGYLVELFKNRWLELTNGKPLLATNHIFNEFSLAAFQEMWNEYVTKAKTQEQKELFVTKMNSKKVWIIDDGSVFTFMFPEDY